MMTIIENTKVKLDKEEEIKDTTDFFLSNNTATTTTSNSNALRQKLREKQQKKINQLSKNPDLKKNTEIPISGVKKFANIKDQSFLVINSSSFELDNQAMGTRSLSMYLKDDMNDDEGGNMVATSRVGFSQHSFTGLTPSEKELIVHNKENDSFEAKNSEEEEKEKDKHRLSMIGRSTKNYSKKNEKNVKKAEKIVVNKRFMYYDNIGEINEIIRNILFFLFFRFSLKR